MLALVKVSLYKGVSAGSHNPYTFPSLETTCGRPAGSNVRGRGEREWGGGFNQSPKPKNKLSGGIKYLRGVCGMSQEGGLFSIKGQKWSARGKRRSITILGSNNGHLSVLTVTQCNCCIVCYA